LPFAPHTVKRTLAALTGIDRHESCFAASKEAPDRGTEPGLPVPFGGNL